MDGALVGAGSHNQSGCEGMEFIRVCVEHEGQTKQHIRQKTFVTQPEATSQTLEVPKKKSFLPCNKKNFKKKVEAYPKNNFFLNCFFEKSN
jgi:hypothetical protein